MTQLFTNLHLNEFLLSSSSSKNSDKKVFLPLSTPYADFNQSGGWSIDKAIDGNPDTAWGIHPEVGKPHFAVFPLKEEFVASNDAQLQFELKQTHGRSHLIGCFRISITDASPHLIQENTATPAEVSQILLVKPQDRTEKQQAHLVYWMLKQELEAELSQLPAQRMIYSGTNQFKPEGTWLGVAR